MEAAWRESVARFQHLRDFVASSSGSAPRGDAAYRVSLYSSWVLLTYAAAEAVIVGQSAACLRVLKVGAPEPKDLPDDLLAQHRRKTIRALLNRVDDEGAGAGQPDFGEALRAIDDSNWTMSSRLMHLGRNVSPDAVRAWLNVIGASAKWMEKAVDDGTETFDSRLAALVRERNDIAHGRPPSQVKSSEVHLAWIDDTERFFEQVVDAAREALLTRFPSVPLVSIGALDASPPSLSDYTAAIERLDADIEVGAKLCFRDSAGNVRVSPVKSLQTGGVGHQQVAAGTQHVAVTLGTKPQGADLYLVV